MEILDSGDALKQSIGKMERDILELNKWVKELEFALVPTPLFPEPLSSMQSILELEEIPESSTK
jgi:hypothetical protein